VLEKNGVWGEKIRSNYKVRENWKKGNKKKKTKELSVLVQKKLPPFTPILCQPLRAKGEKERGERGMSSCGPGKDE